MATNDIPLNEVPRLLKQRGCRVSYPKLWRAAVEGDIPSVRKGSRWYVAASDLDRIAETFTPAEQ